MPSLRNKSEHQALRIFGPLSLAFAFGDDRCNRLRVPTFCGFTGKPKGKAPIWEVQKDAPQWNAQDFISSASISFTSLWGNSRSSWGDLSPDGCGFKPRSQFVVFGAPVGIEADIHWGCDFGFDPCPDDAAGNGTFAWVTKRRGRLAGALTATLRWGPRAFQEGKPKGGGRWLACFFCVQGRLLGNSGVPRGILVDTNSFPWKEKLCFVCPFLSDFFRPVFLLPGFVPAFFPAKNI